MFALRSTPLQRSAAWLVLALSSAVSPSAWGGEPAHTGVGPTPEERPPGGAERAPGPAAPPDPSSEPAAGNVIVPLVMYTPETHIGAGAFFVHFFRLTGMKNSRVSSVALLGLVTSRKQAIFEIHPDFYWAKDAAHVYGKLELQRFPDSFWGVGNAARDVDEERYLRDRVRFRGGPNYRVTGRVYAGVWLDLMYFAAQYPDSAGVFARQNVPGEDGGFTAGLGPLLSLDTRDNAVSTREGYLLSSTLQWFGSPISRYDFRKLMLDYRHFFHLTGDHVIAARFYGETQGGLVPYYHLAMLGGDELLRGYYLGRWRDKNLAAIEAEYRFPLIWRFGGVAFGGLGEIARRVTDLGTEPVRWAVGGGLRFSLNSDEHLNLRLDAGFGPGTYGFYFTAKEAF